MKASSLKSDLKSETSVFETLRRQILSGHRLPGQKLNQQDVAHELNVSRIPVREAFRKLEGEGLVVLETNRGAWVRKYKRIEVRDVFDIRKSLEPMALSLSFDHLNNAILGAAEDTLDKMDIGHDIPLTAKQNWDFHYTLYSPCARPYLLQTLTRLHTASQHMMIIGWSMGLRYHQSHNEHLEILAACRRGLKDKALQLVENHLEEAMNSVVTALDLSAKD